MKYSFVYPNVSELNRRGRGGLAERISLATKTGCTCVELPGDFIKNKTETKLTGLELGSFLDPSAIHALYADNTPDKNARFILHTEPSLPRTDGYGLRYQAPLRWNNPEWVENLVVMIVDICNHLGVPATAVEIHPGDSRNSPGDVVAGCRAILQGFQKSFSLWPTILLENRTGQFISSGAGVRDFWRALEASGADIISNVGVVLDVQQLYSSTRQHFGEELSLVPAESIKALHLHSKHQTPSLHDPIPWHVISKWCRSLKRPILVNPEIHHRGNVPAAIEFCNKLFE